LKKQFVEAAGMDVVSPGWVFAGGSTSMGETAGAFVVDLAEGDWYIGASHIIGEEEEVPELYPLKVTPAVSDQVREVPAADVNVKMSDMKYTIAEETIQSGPQSWEFTSDSSQSHHVVIARTPELVSPDDVAAWAQGMFSGTPTPNSKMDGMLWAGYTALVSGGQTVRTEFDFDPGNYVLICFIFDPETQMPHLMHGMSTSFVVE
jgi:plastocyanin